MKNEEKIRLLEAKIHALEELLSVSEVSFLEESDKLEAAYQLLSKENTYRLFFEASPDAMLTLCDNRFIDCNESAVKMLRAGSKAEVLNTFPWELSPEYQPDGRLSSEEAKKIIKNALEKGALNFEWYHKRMDGEVFPVEVSLTAITFEGKQMINSSWQDLTEKKRAEKELNEYHRHLEQMVEDKTKVIADELEKHKQLENEIRQFLDVSGDAIKVVNNEYVIIYCNKTYYDLFKIDKDLIGHVCHEIDPSENCFTDQCPLYVIPEKREIQTKEKIIDGTPYFVSYAPYFDLKGEFLGIINTYHDMSREKEALKTAEENAIQQGRIEMSNNMLHDIGNAMTGISASVLRPQLGKKWPEVESLFQLQNFCNEMEKELEAALGEEKNLAFKNFITALSTSLQGRNEDYIAFFERISTAVGHVCAVLDLQRHYMREKISRLTTRVNIPSVVNDAFVMLSGSLKKRNIEVKIDISDNTLAISGDQTRLIRVFMNIIKNIYEAFDIKKTQEARYIHVEISTVEDDNKVRISFKDNASGFDQEIAEKIFERGFTTKETGSGIGMHQCRSIIESHGGTMSIESKGLNTGALTVIELPLKK